MNEERVKEIESVDNTLTKQANCGLSNEEIIKKAIEKLTSEKASAKHKGFADAIIGHLTKRCEEDAGLAEDVLQKHKTWERCFKYVYDQARKMAVNNCAAVADSIVYEWAEDYYRKDDTAEEKHEAEEAEKRKKEKGDKAKAGAKKEDKAKAEVVAETEAEEELEVPEQEEPAKKKPKAKAKAKEPKEKKSSELEGQMDIFSLMGM